MRGRWQRMDRILSLLGLCRRAGRLRWGFDECREAARSKMAALLIAAADVSEKTYKNLCYEADRAGIPAIRLRTDMAELGRACGIRAGVAAVTDGGFARAVLKEYGISAENTRDEKEE